MGKRTPQSRAWWETETAFIESEGRAEYPMGQFYSYCIMQARFAREDGFSDLADRILAAKERRN